jgi:hypothetical protein
MLKPYKQRVLSTYAFSETMIEKASIYAGAIIAQRKKARKALVTRIEFPIKWNVDTTRYGYVTFKGYEQAYKPSDATGLNRMYYDRSKPFTKQVRFFNAFNTADIVKAPTAYIIPQGWYGVIDLLKLNNVQMQRFTKDTLIDVEAYHIDDYKSYPRPYEKHHKNMAVKTSVMNQKIRFLKGDYIIYLNQPANRYLVEMLEPTGDDSFFAWNFFDAVLQQKEGYSDYRWDDLAAEVLKNNPDLKAKLEEKKKTDEKFAGNGTAQLDFIYKNSPYYEPGHNRYPVYKLSRK